jgi:succinate dehydrogenase/fumarate reductase flavoprotein subunit
VFWNRFQQKQELKKLKSSLPSDNYPQVVNATTSQPVISQSVITQEITPDNTINDELKIILQTFKKQHPALNVADIENLLETKDNQSIKKAEVLLSQRKKEYEHYIKTENDLKETNARITNLTRRLADGNIDSEAYKRARDDLEQEKKKLEEGLWKLRSILFKEDYEKPY